MADKEGVYMIIEVCHIALLSCWDINSVRKLKDANLLNNGRNFSSSHDT